LDTLAEKLLGAAHRSTVRQSFGVSAELAAPLSTLAGKSGFEALLSRALSMTTAEFPRLRLATVDAARGVNVSEIQPQLSAREFTQGEIALLANLLQLLCLFLGEMLVLRILRDIWPDASLNESDSAKENRA
jgi:hypothetical protein